jgi:hypothetical protein
MPELCTSLQFILAFELESCKRDSGQQSGIGAGPGAIICLLTLRASTGTSVRLVKKAMFVPPNRQILAAFKPSSSGKAEGFTPEFVHFHPLRGPVTTPGASAPPLLIQEGSLNGSPPQMRRGGALGAGVVVNLKGGNSPAERCSALHFGCGPAALRIKT